ncbi:hypothetical protein GOBAR_AA04332 [Gossypium barbadense]|uniref:CCHC-type domain-containing protein n=1 Tax=Gossypium barbadense TaxID=3634 RepID=A0A2P5YL33_GOSBA|nr:hypothetical protein GOBAR_AA04332 [Gossypium barbadense]
MVLAWIRLSNLLGHLYKRKVIEAIRGLIRKMVKLDVQTDNQTRGRFARLVVYINLEKPLISQVIVDGAIQRVEYEALPTVCFACGKYGHVKEMCTMAVIEQNLVVPHRESSCGVGSSNGGKSDDDSMVSRSKEKEPEFGPWMLVEKRYSRRGKRDFLMEVMEKQSKQPLGIRFSVLMGEEDFIGEGGSVDGGFLRENENRKVAANLKGFKPSVSKNIEGVSLDKAGHRVNKGMGLPNRSNMKKGLGSENLEGMGQMSKDILNKSLGKRPMGLDDLDNNNEESSDKLPISNFSNVVSAVLNCVDSQNDTHFDVVGAQGPLASKNQTNIDAEDLENIKAHYNPVFDESESFIVPISDNTLDPFLKTEEAMVVEATVRPLFLYEVKGIGSKLLGTCAFL